VQQRTKKSSHFEITNCGQAKPKCSNAPKNLVILKKQTVDKRNRSAARHQKIQSFSNDKLWRNETEVQQRTKKYSHFQMTNCREAKPKCSNTPKNLVILKKQTMDKRNRNAATNQKI